jgi:alpha-N-arabinofuranosidase
MQPKQIVCGLALLLAVNDTAAESASIRIRVDEKSGPPVSKRLFGQFTEHLGRNVYGGAWAQVLENPGFESAEMWGDADQLVTWLKQLGPSLALPGLGDDPARGIAPGWAGVGQLSAALTAGVNGRAQLLQTTEALAGLRTPVFLHSARYA